MGDGNEPDDKVVNQYRSALVGARDNADTRAATIRSALNDASTAMMNGAWASTKADTFGIELADQRGTLQRVADDEREAIDAEVSTQPERVPKNSWQANFARLSRMEMY